MQDAYDHRSDVSIKCGAFAINGELAIPHGAGGVVIFAHGSGSSRFSKRNQYVAAVLRRAGLGTLLLDLLTEDEADVDAFSRAYRFNIPLLADRLVSAAEWLQQNEETEGLKLGFFGSSTGAAAALVAASEMVDSIAAVVSRGGRPDLAGEALWSVRCPVLLIVGGRDEYVLQLNRNALELIKSDKDLIVVPGATHLFEEEGALEEVAELAADWFTTQFRADAHRHAAA